MNIEDLKKMSNQEINELSAVYVMEWRSAGKDHRGIALWRERDKENECVNLTMDGTEEWNPAEDMNDAMRLVDKLQDTKPADTNARWLNFSFEQMKYGAITYNAFITDEETNKTYDGNGKTAALAISYACLLAVMDS